MKFEVGQVWTYHTRPIEQASRIIICRVEHERGQEIVHIFVSGLRIKNSKAASGVSDHIMHMPFDSDALRKDVVTLETRSVPLPDYEEGYREWRTAFDAGKAGVWTTPVSRAVGIIESAMNQ